MLDIGCSGGSTGKLVKEKYPETHVIGIELNAHAAERARQRLDAVICAGMDSIDPRSASAERAWTPTCCSTSWSTCTTRGAALRRIHGWLEPGARASPACQTYATSALDQLAGGRWDYDKNGVLDITLCGFSRRARCGSSSSKPATRCVILEPLAPARARRPSGPPTRPRPNRHAQRAHQVSLDRGAGGSLCVPVCRRRNCINEERVTRGLALPMLDG